MARIVTSAEAEALLRFRANIPDLLEKFTEYQRHDYWLLKWLRDKELNIDRAERMLRQSLKWREEENMDEILDYWTAPEYIVQRLPFQIPGVDKDGCPIVILPFGKWNLKKVISKGYRNDTIRFAAQCVEMALAYLVNTSTKDKHLSRFVMIIDFDGFSLARVMNRETIEMLSEILRLYKAHYPETLKAAWVLNVPKYFDIFFRLMKPMLTTRTLARVHVHGYGGWREKLLNTIDADHMSSPFGGSNTTLKLYRIEDKFDVFSNHKTFPLSELTSVEIKAGEKLDLNYKLTEGTKMSWNFRTEKDDIGYTVEFQENSNDDEIEIIFYCEKADAHLHVQKGAILVEKDGIYTLVLDNSRSLMTTKTVHYSVRIDSS